ncbi:glycine cleavage system protein GcvH [Halocatena pleomorpha]|uniref:Probable glycine cleavage system H protein n=1 Tax=Halocatena pleomorpha TaxID=1785090 RepID=A0A3P3R338_9EURY|nr:glycine cleavage system protein GcvH [Halocatena pleomorpha]RRJ27764.1 glycine cleavage system protein GcvH [Halocatena pleomorpha]
MSFEIPEDCYYLETHEWARINEESGTARVGISEFAQDELGDIVFVELPEPGEEIDQDGELGVVESIKAVSDLYSPLSGTVATVNEAVFDEPERLNDDPYGDGWLLELDGIDTSETDALLTAEEYEQQIE